MGEIRGPIGGKKEKTNNCKVWKKNTDGSSPPRTILKSIVFGRTRFRIRLDKSSWPRRAGKQKANSRAGVSNGELPTPNSQLATRNPQPATRNPQPPTRNL